VILEWGLNILILAWLTLMTTTIVRLCIIVGSRYLWCKTLLIESYKVLLYARSMHSSCMQHQVTRCPSRLFTISDLPKTHLLGGVGLDVDLELALVDGEREDCQRRRSQWKQGQGG
jgi:hypothetical protein